AEDDVTSVLARLTSAHSDFAAEWATLFPLGAGSDNELRSLIALLEELEDATDEFPVSDQLAQFFDQIAVAGGEAAVTLEEIREAHPDASDLEIYRLFSTEMKTQADAADQAGTAHEQLEATLDKVVDAAEEARDAEQELAEELRETADAAREAQEAIQEQTDARFAAIDATFAHNDAEDDFIEKVEAANEVLADGDASLRDVRQALDDASGSAIDLANSAVRIARDNAEANGETLKASRATSIWNREMVAAASTTSGPVRDAIIQHIADINDIPVAKATEILADLDEDSVDVSAQRLDAVSVTRTAELRAEADVDEAERRLNYIGRPRTVLYHARTTGDLPSNPRGHDVAFARGTKGTPPHEHALVGEQGPEIVSLPTGSQVMTAADTRRVMTQPQRAGTTIINMPAGVRPMDYAQAARRYTRIQGPI
ncbi:MAG: hypothetical protein AAGF91_03450, partial [Actinomycetota bacterium]